MDIKIAGSGTVAAGEYKNVHISGSGRIAGPIRCTSLHCAGSVRGSGDIEVVENLKTSGSATFENNVTANSVSFSGSGRVEGSCTIRGEGRFAGSFHCGGALKGNTVSIGGSAKTASIEAEEITICGKIVCHGLLNAEKITVKMDGSASEIGNIGGSLIRIYPEWNKRETRLPLLSKLLGKGEKSRLVVQDSIEGDEIALENVTAKTVVGRTIAIGAGCRVDLVQYSEQLEISPDAVVEKQEKIAP